MLCSAPSEGSEPVQKKARLDINTLPEDDVAQFDIDIGDTRMLMYVEAAYLALFSNLT